MPLKIYADDTDPEMVKHEKQNAELADVRDEINVTQRDTADLKPKEDFCVIIGNPPYGERLEDAREVHQLYWKIGNAFRKFPYYSVHMITSYVEFEKTFGHPATKRRKLYNGNIEV